MSIYTAFFIAVAYSIPLSIYLGFALSTLWAWFVVPTLDAPALSIPAAIGIALTVRMFTHPPKYKEIPEHEYGARLFNEFVGGLLSPTLALVAGGIVKQFM